MSTKTLPEKPFVLERVCTAAEFTALDWAAPAWRFHTGDPSASTLAAAVARVMSVADTLRNQGWGHKT